MDAVDFWFKLADLLLETEQRMQLLVVQTVHVQHSSFFSSILVSESFEIVKSPSVLPEPQYIFLPSCLLCSTSSTW